MLLSLGNASNLILPDISGNPQIQIDGLEGHTTTIHKSIFPDITGKPKYDVDE